MRIDKIKDCNASTLFDVTPVYARRRDKSSCFMCPELFCVARFASLDDAQDLPPARSMG
jgi:hypothetical protein